MPMYNLLEYSENYSINSGSLWNYYGVDDANENNDDGYRINNNKITETYKSFEYKTETVVTTPNNNSRLDAGVVVLLVIFGDFLICL